VTIYTQIGTYTLNENLAFVYVRVWDSEWEREDDWWRN